ncbi:hypothetical protein PC128_g10081 [Phytophthora cactorum]|nr:hypothetical protein PC128_g10081 [Phytophthora cactorum]
MKASASMRQARALAVLIAVTLLVACEAFSMDPASDKMSKVSSPTSQVQRLLTTRHTTNTGNAESEERSLTFEDMMGMMTAMKSKEAYASELGIATKMDDFINKHAPDIEIFKGSEDFKKYQAYMNFLNVMQHNEDYGRLVRMIKDGNIDEKLFKALLAKIKNVNPKSKPSRWKLVKQISKLVTLKIKK